MARNSRTRDVYPISLRELTVVESFDLTPGMRRVVFTGESLRGCVIDGVEMPPLVSTGFDDDMRLILPDPATGKRPYPAPLGDGRLDWNEEVTPLFRTYTVRSFDEDALRLTVDFARHGQGLAETWAAGCQPGDVLWAAGPKYCASLPDHRDLLVLVGDATALPAIGRALEELDDSQEVVAFIGVHERSHIQDLSHGPRVEVRWCVADEGGDPFDELSAWIPPQTESVYVWAAGESGRLKQVRAFVKKHGIDRADVDVTGYWRQAASEGASSNAVVRRLAALADIAPGLIFGAAVNAGVFPLVDDGATTPAELALASGIDEGRLMRLVRWLGSQGLLTVDVDGVGTVTRIGLTPLSRELADPDSKISARLTGASAAGVQSLMNLSDALVHGGPVPVGTGSQTLADMIASTPRMAAAAAEQQATAAAWVAPAIAANIDLIGADTGDESATGDTDGDRALIVVGPAAGVYADEAIRRGVITRAIIPAQSSPASGEAVRDIDPARRHAVTVSSDVASLHARSALVVDPFGETAHPEHMLRELDVNQVIIVTEMIEAAADAEDLEHDLIRMTLTGGMTPTRGDIARVAAAAGLSIVHEQPVGWGHHAVTLKPRT